MTVTLERSIWFQVARRVAVRPGLWYTTVRQIARLAGPQWWRRSPRLPVPPPEYMAFRMQTAYGPDGQPSADDVVAYLEWCRDMGRRSRGRGAVRR